MVSLELAVVCKTLTLYRLTISQSAPMAQHVAFFQPVPNIPQGRAIVQYPSNQRRYIFVGYIKPDPATGERKEIWASWTLPEGTAPANLLEKCLIFNSAECIKRLNWEKITLDLSTAPAELFWEEGDYDSEETKAAARLLWEYEFGEPLHRGKTYTGNETICR